MAEWEESYGIKSDGGPNGGSAAPWLAFLVGALLVAVIAVFLLNAHGTIRGPAGHITFNTISSVASPAVPLPHI